MAPLLPWPAMLWLLPFTPRLIAAARLAIRKRRASMNLHGPSALKQQAQRALNLCNLEILKLRSLLWNG